MVDFAVGDKVKITPYYLDNYLDMAKYKDKEAEVVWVKSKTVRHADLSVLGGDRARFVEKYGKMDVYPLIELRVKYPDENIVYIVSPFGYDK
jgi:hypothetical protein